MSLEEKANTFRPLAHLGADLFFAIDGLSILITCTDIAQHFS